MICMFYFLYGRIQVMGGFRTLYGILSMPNVGKSVDAMKILSHDLQSQWIYKPLALYKGRVCQVTSSSGNNVH